MAERQTLWRWKGDLGMLTGERKGKQEELRAHVYVLMVHHENIMP